MAVAGGGAVAVVMATGLTHRLVHQLGGEGGGVRRRLLRKQAPKAREGRPPRPGGQHVVHRPLRDSRIAQCARVGPVEPQAALVEQVVAAPTRAPNR